MYIGKATSALPFRKPSPLKPRAGLGRGANRFFRNLPALPPIEEEDEDEQRRTPARTRNTGTKVSFAPGKQLRVHQMDIVSGADEVEDEDGGDMAEWDAEATLVSLLQDAYVSLGL